MDKQKEAVQNKDIAYCRTVIRKFLSFSPGISLSIPLVPLIESSTRSKTDTDLAQYYSLLLMG